MPHPFLSMTPTIAQHNQCSPRIGIATVYVLAQLAELYLQAKDARLRAAEGPIDRSIEA
jgi:hypothetical protein